jgi:hypothetical protein
MQELLPSIVDQDKRRNIRHTVVKMFIESFPHMPSQKRLDLFVILIQTLSSDKMLHLVVLTLLEEAVRNHEIVIFDRY